MEFAGGGREALQRLSESHYDVLVTDLRMPEVDGIALLSEAIGRCPQTVRIVLCDEADLSATLRSLSLAHQYLVKPCDAATMQATVEKALDLIRPALQNDGGDIELIDVDEATGVVKVKLVGACGSCPMSQMTLRMGVERVLKEEVPEVTEVEAV